MRKMITIIIVILVLGLLILGVVIKRHQANISQRINESQSSLDPGDYSLSSRHDGRNRSYKLHIPPSYNKNTKTPVVIYLHGGGGSTDAAEQDGLNSDSDKFGFILVAPGGTGIFPDKFLTWNSGQWDGGTCCGSAYQNNIDDVGFISSLIDEVKTKVNVDPKRIYATGISNGAMMSYRLACELTNKIAAVAAVAPPAVPAGCNPSRPIAIMHIHGTADPCVPINGGKGGGCLSKAFGFDSSKDTFVGQSAVQMVNWWVKANGCLGDSSPAYAKGKANCQSYGECRSGTEVQFCKVEDMGHIWPGGHQYLPAKLVGLTSYDISFDQMWEFFQKHSMK
jgi:polyhydroxybutyrate depolymerase